MPPVQWIQSVAGANVARTGVQTATLTRGAAADAWTAGACSTQAIAGDGFLEFVVDSTGKYRAIGFSVVAASSSINQSQIGNGIYLKGGATPTDYGVIEGGVEVLTSTYAAGDVFRVQRVGTQVTYYKNGERVWTAAAAVAGARMVDAAMFTASSLLQNVRLYDGTAKAWTAITWTVTNTTAAAGALLVPRRLTFAAPTKMQRGDQLVVIMASQGAEFISSTNITWEFVDAFTSPTRLRGVAVYRHVVTDADPTSYSIDLNVTQETLGALLLYRGLDVAPIVGGSAVDFTAVASFPCPSRTLTRYSDLYLAIVLLNPSGSVDGNPPGSFGPLAYFTQSALGVSTLRLYVAHYIAETVGATGALSPASVGNQSGIAASVALQGLPAPSGPSFNPPISGAIGLPTEGI